jgi:hypothetical protein
MRPIGTAGVPPALESGRDARGAIHTEAGVK